MSVNMKYLLLAHFNIKHWKYLNKNKEVQIKQILHEQSAFKNNLCWLKAPLLYMYM